MLDLVQISDSQRHAKAKAYVYMLYCFSTQILKEHEAEAKKCPTEGADGNGGDALFTWSARVVLLAIVVYCWLECPKMGKDVQLVSLADAAYYGVGKGDSSGGGLRVFTPAELATKKGGKGKDGGGGGGG